MITSPLFRIPHSALRIQRRRAGKIARLPPAVREQINLMLQDGLTYAQIITRLGDAGKHLNKDNLSRWRRADHQDWLQQQLWLQLTRDRPKLANNPLARAFVQFDPDSLNELLARQPAKVILIYNFIAKTSTPAKTGS